MLAVAATEERVAAALGDLPEAGWRTGTGRARPSSAARPAGSRQPPGASRPRVCLTACTSVGVVAATEKKASRTWLMASKAVDRHACRRATKLGKRALSRFTKAIVQAPDFMPCLLLVLGRAATAGVRACGLG